MQHSLIPIQPSHVPYELVPV
ncbi:BgtE-20113 [Blumeria graminis f. sp. tritici]|uniref:BgtE-20113 n=1 Tax=Blumeria graminis f. sp. tritici TaxID=62690 RepID=A0A9X9PSU7_BLUGR|nr:BgtE-20113 [Blumeria graminis f. sp. tritici]